MGTKRHEAVMLRPARTGDVRGLARLIMLAGGGVPEVMWARDALPGESVLDVGARRLRRQDATFGYRSATVAEIEGALVGMLLGYRQRGATPEAIAEVDALPAFVRPLVLLELEAPGSFYVSILAVEAEWQGLGVGELLLRQAEARARRAGCTELSLQVYSDNDQAIDFYRRQHFVWRAERATVPYPGARYGDRAILLTRPVPQR